MTLFNKFLSKPSKLSKLSKLSKHSTDEFFLPNFCSAHTLFALVLLTELLVVAHVFSLPDSEPFDWDQLAISSLFVQWTLISSSVALCWLRALLFSRRVAVSTFFCLLVVVLITAAVTLIMQWVLWKDAFIEHYPDRSQLVRHCLVALLITALMLRYFYIQHEVVNQQKANLKARFQALQARINPHFLFNSMNSIATLIHQDPNGAEEAVLDLATLFRSSLQTNRQLIPLSEEIELCKRYLRIEKHRLGERLHTEWSLEQIPDDATIAPLTLQPVVENAISHGVQTLAGGGTVRIDVAKVGGNITIRVMNPIPAVSRQNAHGNQLALSNIRSRLNILYGRKASIETQITDETQPESMKFITLITYPYGDRNDENSDMR